MITFKQALETDAKLHDYLAAVSIKNFRVELDELFEHKFNELDELFEHKFNELDKCRKLGATMALDFLTGNPTPLVAVTDERISRN